MNIAGTYYQPTFLYESLWCFIGFIILRLLRHKKYLKVGTITGVYFIWYSVERFFVESLRTDSLMLGDFKIAQLVSVLLILIGLFLIIRTKKGSKFEDLYAPDVQRSYAPSDLVQKNINILERNITLDEEIEEQPVEDIKPVKEEPIIPKVVKKELTAEQIYSDKPLEEETQTKKDEDKYKW
jgi:hypothetical protein